jgi:localization factor PodJL
MRRHVLSNLDDLDLDARELAKAAARRAGLSLEEWIERVLIEQTGRPDPSPMRVQRQAGDDFDKLIARLSKTTRPRQNNDHETLMAALAAESERQSQEHASRTAIALESMASWIEQAEERLNETARASADHQDRMASALSQALTTLKDRLDSVERQVVSDRAAPPRIEFPVQDALKALAPLSETLVGLRTDMSRLAERLEQPNPAWTPQVNGIRAEIERLRSSMGGLATREEITALDRAIRDIAKDIATDLEQGRSSKDLLTLASSIAALYQQIQSLSEDVSESMHRRIGSEIDLIKGKIDKISETGVDRSVIDFLSSQIVDMRQDLAHRADPQQIARLSDDVTALSRQIADLRINQVGRSDFATLKTSLENVCSALNRTVAAQEASDVPDQLQNLSQRLDILVRRPEPANLGPISEQLALLAERIAALSDSRLEQSDTLTEMVGRLSSQVQAVAEKEAPSQEPLMQRFDRIEQELRQVGQQADTSSIELMLRSIDEKLARSPAQPPAFDVIEQQIMALAERFAQTPGEPLRKVLDEATGHLKSLHEEAAGIAERAAKTALRDIQPNLPDAGDFDLLKQGFVEMKALQTRTDKKTQETLRAVHHALETLVARFPDRNLAVLPARPGSQVLSELPSDKLQPADRLEAAVRRLHAAALSQIEDVSTAPLETTASERLKAGAPGKAHVEPEALSVTMPSQLEESDLGNVRVSFIAAARRAAQAVTPDQTASAVFPPLEQEAILVNEPDQAASEETSLSPSSLIERIRRTFDSHRRPLLFGLAFLILAAGTAQILSGGQSSPLLASAPATERPQVALVQEIKPPSQDPVTGAESAQISMEKPNFFQSTSLAAEPAPLIPPASAKFLVDPTTIGEIPAQVPAVLRQAALSGDAAAIYDVASRAAEGRGLDQNTVLATRLYERAAQAGLPPAQERLAMLYEKGIGVPRDLKLAAIWYERAAQGGNIRAMHNLATLLASGINGKPNYATALRWYNEAAEAGLRDSQFNMGVLLTRGIGTDKDLALAFKWFALAARQGDPDAAKKRDEIVERLSPSELAAATTSLEQWRPRTVDPVANEIPPQGKGRTASLDRTLDSRS